MRSLVLLFMSFGSLASATVQEDAARSLSQEMDWRSLGPAHMGGRIIDLAVNPEDACEWWAATASGGLLHTENDGLDFEHQFDSEAVVSIGAIALAPSNSKVLWVGTGESNPRNSVSFGRGVYRSTDGGQSFEARGLEDTFQIGCLAVHPTDADTVYVAALGRLWGPNDERGVFKTTDGGETWDRVLFVDADTGAVEIALHPTDPETLLVATYQRRRDAFDGNDPAVKWGPGGGLWRSDDGGKSFLRVRRGLPTCQLGRIGIDWSRQNPNVVFAVVESEAITQIPEDSAWLGVETEDAELGTRITKVQEGSPAAEAGLAKDDVLLRIGEHAVLSRIQLLRVIRLHKAGTSVDVFYAREREASVASVTFGRNPATEEDSGEEWTTGPFHGGLGGQRENIQEQQGEEGFQYGGVYRSDDAGLSWTRINSLNPRPMYFSQIRVDPSDDQHIYVLGVSLYRSSDGGQTFTSDGGGRNVHVDHHALWIDPADGRHIILGNDGGLYVTRDRMDSWDHHNQVALGQFYAIAVDARRDFWVYGGLQDNGTWGGPHRSAGSPGVIGADWLRIGGGDGFVCAIDPEDPDQLYYESQNGGLMRRHLGTGETRFIRPRGKKGRTDRWNWRTPFLISSYNPRIWYAAGNRVFRSVAKGDDAVPISPELSLTERGSATALAECPLQAGRLYVGTDDGALWRTDDDGGAWTDLLGPAPEAKEAEPEDPEPETEPATEAPDPEAEPATAAPEPEAEPTGIALEQLIPGSYHVSAIQPSRHQEGRVYVAFDGHRSDDDQPLVFVSEDFGGTWSQPAAEGLDPRAPVRALIEDRVHPDLLYLGTELGAFFSLDRGNSWQTLGSNLPTVAVHSFAEHVSTGDLLVGTHGRGIYSIDVTSLRQLDSQAREAEAWLFAPAPVVRWRREPSRGSATRRFAVSDPRGQAVIDYHLGTDAADLSLTIEDSLGRTVAELDAESKAGLHRVTWNLSLPSAGRRRRSAPPGTYAVILRAGDTTRRQPFEIELDPSTQDPAYITFDEEAEALEAELEAQSEDEEL